MTPGLWVLFVTYPTEYIIINMPTPLCYTVQMCMVGRPKNVCSTEFSELVKFLKDIIEVEVLVIFYLK